MKCDQILEKFADDWAGSLDPDDRAQYESHLAACASCREERESLNRLWIRLGRIPSEDPGPAVRQRFHAMLEGYRQGMGQSREATLRRGGFGEWLGPLFRLQPAFQLGLLVMLLAGGFVAGYLARASRNGREEIAALRAEVHEMRQMTTISLLRQQSASERLKGVYWSSQVDRPDPEFLSTLVHTLNYDPNVDVRLAAADALARFAGYSGVRQDLIKSLSMQESPLVQISLIDLLVQLHERQSIKVLRQLIDDANQNPQVRDRAQWGLQRLS